MQKTGNDEVFGCEVTSTDIEVRQETPTDQGEDTSLPVGAFGIVNGLMFFYYIPFLLIFSALWTYFGDDHSRKWLTELCFGKQNSSSDPGEVAKTIGVGTIAILGILISVADLIAAGVSEKCDSAGARAYIALNVFVTLINVVAAIQVTIVFYWEKIFNSKS